MKHFILLSLSVIGLIGSSLAQALIPKIGISMSTLRAAEFIPEMNNEYSNNVGYTLGLGYNIPVIPVGHGMLSIQPEMNFLQKGFKIDAAGDFYFGELYYKLKTYQVYTLNYLEFPAPLKYEFGSDKIGVAVYAGPYVGFALGGKYTATATRENEEVSEEFINAKGKIIFYESNEPNELTLDHNVDYGLVAGISATVFNRIVLDARYGGSFADLKHNEKSKNQALQFSVGVPIHLN